MDLRYALRMLRLNPGFSLVAILSLALGTGANTAIFQLMNAILLRTLPVASPQELAEVRIPDTKGARGVWLRDPALTYPLWEKIRGHQQAFSGIFAWADDSFNISPGGEGHGVGGLWVSGDFFRVLGIRPALGRLFNAQDDQRGCGLGPGLVVSYAFWQRELGGDPNAIGRRIPVGRQELEVIGITPPEFFGLEVGRRFDLALPICALPALRTGDARLDSGTTWWLTVMGRLRPDVPLDRASSLLGAESAGILESTLPANYPQANVRSYLSMRFAALPAGTGTSRMRDEFSKPLALLLAIAAAVLLITCTNLANLMLARAGVRQREVAVRLALGASRARISAQFLAEGFLLAVAGAGCGLVLARFLSGFLVSFLTTRGAFYLAVPDDLRVFAFAAGLAAATCLIFAAAPALRASATDPGGALKSGGRSTMGREKGGMRRLLAASQVALSLALLMSTLLFTQSLRNLETVNAGFDRHGLLVADIGFGPPGMPPGRAIALRREALERLRATPGVASVAEAPIVPLTGESWGENWSSRMWMEGSDESRARVSMRSMIGAGYFGTMKTPLLAGRALDESDLGSPLKVAVVNEEFAHQFTGGANPVGRRFWIEATPAEPQAMYLIVGLAKNAKYRDLREPFQPIAYLPMPRDALEDAGARFVVRSSGSLDVAAPAIRKAINALDTKLRYRLRILDAWADESLLRERLLALISTWFGALAAILTAVGLYGLISYSAAQRTNEIGIRMALGAGRRSVVALICRETATVLLAGLGAGTALALATGRAAAGLLFGIKWWDPATLSFAMAALAVIGTVASCIPASRASGGNPVEALRRE
jgi:putative ABC transport system permease protein